MAARTAGGTRTIRGIVTPESWDKDFNVKTVKISTEGEKDYLVTMNRKGEELIRHLRESMKISGRIRKRRDGTQMITVDDFEVSVP